MAAASIASIQYSEEKEIVVHEGDPGDALYLVLEGRLAVIQADSARGEVKLDTITEGGFFGEMALIDGNPRSATVRSETPSVLLRITGKEFERIIKDFPAVPINVCRVFMRRIRDLHSHLQAAPRRVPAMPS
jgi:CRP-like cAMP-binding protein